MYVCVYQELWSLREWPAVMENAEVTITHLCLEIYLTSVVRTCHTYENNFGTKHKLAKYLKESCR